MKKRSSGSLEQLNEQPTVRKIAPDSCKHKEPEVRLEKMSFLKSGICRLRVYSDDAIKQVAASSGFLRIMPPATAILVVLTVILHMTVGGGAALRPQEEISCVPDGVYQLAEYETSPYLDSDFNRSASEVPSIDSDEDIVPEETTATVESSIEEEALEITAVDIEDEIETSDMSEDEQGDIVVSDEEADSIEDEQPAFTEVDQTLYLGAENVNLRTEPDTSSDIVDVIALASELRRTEISEEWSFVTDENGQSGYMMNQFLVDIKPTPTPTPTPAPTPTPTPKPTAAPPAPVQASPDSAISAEMQTKMVNKARSHLGDKYVWANSGPNQFDCSGFTSYMYRSLYGMELPRTTSGQMSSGISVKLDDIQIGDIICFDWKYNGSCDHVGLYIGGGQYIHASYSRGRVAEGTIRPGRDPIISVRRIVY